MIREWKGTRCAIGQTFFLFSTLDSAVRREEVTSPQISNSPETSADAVPFSMARSRAPKQSSKASSANFGAAKDQRNARDLEDWRYSSSLFCAGRCRELDNRERTIGNNGTRFKRGRRHVLPMEAVLELSEFIDRHTA